MGKIIVLHDTVNGKRRVVRVTPTTIKDSCKECAIDSPRVLCETARRERNEFTNRVFTGLPVCGFKDVFEPEDL